MDNRWDSMIDDKYDFGFAVDLMVKDLEIVSKFSKRSELIFLLRRQLSLTIKNFTHGVGRLIPQVYLSD